MIEKLKELSKNITSLIDNDDFTADIRPTYLRDAVKKYPMQGGKRVRVALLMWSCGILGGKVEEADYHAAAVEIWHNWTLVHDDIIDQDITRRGESSTHIELSEYALNKFNLSEVESKKYGENFAILCGDLQQSWSNSMIIKAQKKYNLSANLTLEILEKMQKLAAIDLISGEALDVELAVRELKDITSCEILEMIDLKTAALFRCACEIGGALALGSFQDEKIKILSKFATSLGLAFQLQDDILGTFGDFSKLGKDIGSDIRERKPTVLLLKTLEYANDVDRRAIFALLGKKEIELSELELVKSIMKKSGAYDYVISEIERYTFEAKKQLEELPQNEYNKNLSDLLNFLLNREV